jgi:hypothetical protein
MWGGKKVEGLAEQSALIYKQNVLNRITNSADADELRHSVL